MNKILAVAKREFKLLIRSKWFKVFIILPFLGMGVIFLISTFSPEEGFGKSEEKIKITRIGVVDYSGRILPYMEDIQGYEFIGMDSISALDRTMGGEIKGFLVIPEKPDSFRTRYYSRTVEFEVNEIESYLSNAALKWRLKEKGIDISLAENLNRRIRVSPKKITEKGEKGGGEELLGFGVIMVIFLYMFILLASQLMARSAVEEKLNGMIELIISDISPIRLLSGKLLGITAAILLLVAVWFIVGITFVGNALAFISTSINLSLPTGLILYYIGALIFGYTLYTSFVLLFVSTVNTDQEVNQAMSVGVMLILVPYFLSLFLVIRKPDSVVSVIASLFPFFTPLVMPLRLSISSVPFWQAILSIVILAVTAWGVLFLAGKIYRVSMLMVGKPLRLSEVFRLIRKK